MTTMSTHVLDLVRGGPAAGVPITLEHNEGGVWVFVTQAHTDDDGRISPLLPAGGPESGTFRITFDTASYFQKTGHQGFYPYVPVVFTVREPGGHYHVPLLLGPFGYSTYRGS